jgi:hypothetical protein
MNFSEIANGGSFVLPLRSNKTAYMKLNQFYAEIVSENIKRLAKTDYSQPKKVEIYPKAIVMPINCDPVGNAILPEAYRHISLERWQNATLPLNWQHYGKRIVWKEAKLTIHYQEGSENHKRYKVVLDAGVWPGNNELARICNGQAPESAYFIDFSIEDHLEERIVSIFV